MTEFFSRRRIAIFCAFAGFLVLFVIANRGAYRGYFSGDDLDSLGWAQWVGVRDLAIALVSPFMRSSNFRAVGHLMYVVLGHTAGLNFPVYVFYIQALHVITVVLLWFLLRRLQFSDFQASIGAFLFGFNMAVFDIYWKPMYDFDLLCGLFSIVTIWLYINNRWILALVTFCLAYKSKEIAVMLPFVVLAYEYLLGEKRWKRVLPMGVIGAFLIVQAIIYNAGRHNDYTFVFSPGALGQTIEFYSSALFFLPYAGLVLLVVPIVSKDRRAWFGLCVFLLFLAPLLFLPGRLFSAYVYTPLIGLSILGAWLARFPVIAAIVVLLWIPWNYREMRIDRNAALASADDNRRYVTTLAAFHNAHGPTRAYVLDQFPASLNDYGAKGAVYFFDPDASIHQADDPDIRKALQQDSIAVLHWDGVFHRLLITNREPTTTDAAYIAINAQTPIWQLEDGWYGAEGVFRWTAPHATAVIQCPPAARLFELRAIVNDELIARDKEIHLHVSLNGVLLEQRTVTDKGVYTFTWAVPPRIKGKTAVDLRVDPPYDPYPDHSHPLGIAVTGFGFK